MRASFFSSVYFCHVLLRNVFITIRERIYTSRIATRRDYYVSYAGLIAVSYSLVNVPHMRNDGQGFPPNRRPGIPLVQLISEKYHH